MRARSTQRPPGALAAPVFALLVTVLVTSPPLPSVNAEDGVSCILDRYQGPIAGKRAKAADVLSVASDVESAESCGELCTAFEGEKCKGFSFRLDRGKCVLSTTDATEDGG